MGLFAALIEAMRKPTGGLTLGEVGLTPTPVASALRDRSLFKPQAQALALEQRLMFDGAAAGAADQQHGDSARPHEPATAERASSASESARSEAASNSAAAPPTLQASTLPAQHLLVVDSRVEQRELLSAQVQPGVTVLVVDTQQDGIAAISAALSRMGQVDSIQILSHGAAGQFTLGHTNISSGSVDRLAPQLQGWQSALTEDADIQLYGCSIGAGAAGQTLVNELARWTGADVGASIDDTGAASAGGNWTLETTAGQVDKALVLGEGTIAAFDGLLADAAPTVNLSAGGDDVLLGDTFTLTASFTNTSTMVGYAPYIDLFIPATGKDGDDGVTFVSATYLGQAIRTFTLTFDANGQAIHPLAKDASGNALIINAADFGMRAGDQFVVLQLPNASIVQGQPPIDIVVTLSMSNLADTTVSDPAPDLTIVARGGFQFGNDPADNPTQDPSLVEVGTHAFVAHPTMIEVTQVVNVPDGNTVTGPNFPRSIVVTATTASDQALNNVTIAQDLPPNILVTSIVPGAGGTLVSITLHDGQVLTDPGDIANAFASAAYIDHYEVNYATLTGSVDTTINFFVPEVDADGNPVLDPVTGAPVGITVAAPEGSAEWDPLDPRDTPPPGTLLTGTGDPASFQARSITVYKEATVTGDIGAPGATPGDTVTYAMDIQISDFFAFGKNILENGTLVIQDIASDGQVFVPGTGTLTFTVAGVEQSIALVATAVANPNGTTTLTLDLAQSLRNAGRALGALNGDLAFDALLEGATSARVTYQTTIGQDYATPHPHDPINEGDAVSNMATVTGTVLEDPLNLTGGQVSHTDSATVQIEPNQVDIVIVSVVRGGTSIPVDSELRPGDIVTFGLSYDLATDDYEQFKLTAYLPLPLFDVTGITWAGGTGVNQWIEGPGDNHEDVVQSVTSSTGNSIVFDYSDHSDPGLGGSRIELRFTMMVGNQPFGDQRKVTVQAQSDQLTTVDQAHIFSNDAVVIQSIAEPVLDLKHGVVSTNADGVITGTTGTWADPGDTGVPFAVPLTEIAAVDGSITDMDAGDVLRLATAIENSGGGPAFDVVTTVTLPAGLAFVGGDLANTLRIYRGDGTLLVAGTDYSVSGNTVTFLDPLGNGSLLPGRPGTPEEASGENVAVLIYEVQVDALIGAGSTLETLASLDFYAASDGGPDFAPSNPADDADQQVAAPVIRKGYADGTLSENDSSAVHTTGSNLVVGESMLYDIVVTLPEGSAQNLRIDDLIPEGLRLDTSFNGGAGYQIIILASQSGALTANFNGILTAGVPSGIGGTAGDDGVDARLTFSASTNDADNNAGNNSFVIRVRLIASNSTGNQTGRALNNQTQMTYVDPDGDAPGAAAVDRVVGMTGAAPTATVQEPVLTVTQATIGVPAQGVDEGVTFDYVITISNTGGFAAFDIAFDEAFPTDLGGLAIVSVDYTGATNNGVPDFEVVGNQLRAISGANIDISAGGTIVIRVSATVGAQAASQATLDSTATVRWTSLDGTSNVAFESDERTGEDGLLNSGALNDYRVQNTIAVPVLSGLKISRIGGMADTPPATGGTDGEHEQTAVGEVIRYRVVGAVAQGVNADYSIQVTLDQGLNFLNDGTVRIALISNTGITSTVTLVSNAGQLQVVGDRSAAEAQSITPDLSGSAPAGVLLIDRIEVTTDGQGRTVLIFRLGTLTNTDSDPDLEGVSLEFNVRADNVAGNQAGDMLGATARVFTNTDSATPTLQSTSDTVFQDIVEPSFNSVVKQVDSFTPNATGTTSLANVSVRFTQNGGASAYDVFLTDSITGAISHQLTGVRIGGVDFLPSELAGQGVTFTQGAAGITLDFDNIVPGTEVIVFYTVEVENDAAYANTDAVLTWSSLPETFTTWGGSAVGTDGTTQGERTGTDGVQGGGTLNDYQLSEGAGLGLVTGTLWDDTLVVGSGDITTPDGPLLANQTVTLTWGGADGDLATTADNQVFTTVTDSAGFFHFSALAAGNYRIDAPTPITLAQPTGELRVRADSDGATLGQVLSSVGEGASSVANAAYVQLNDAPVNAVPAVPQEGLEDVPLPLDPISISDVDANLGGTPRIVEVVLSVNNGTLQFTASLPGLVETGFGTSTMTLSGTIAQINVSLATLVYTGNLNFNGTDTLTITTRDQGNFGDFDGNGTPGELTDQREDVDTVQIVLAPVNDAPQGVNDAALATEAGGTLNSTPGVNPTGNLLDNDIDVDIATNNDVLHLVDVEGVAVTGVDPVEIVGQFGSLFVTANGAYQYVVDNDNAQVQALRLSGQTLGESFSYTLADIELASSTGVLTVTIQGANDTPVGVNDVGTAIEAGGANNTAPGSNATGDVLGNDTDVDAVLNGETKRVTGIRAGLETDPGPLQPIDTPITGKYGALTINAAGVYTYLLDESNAAVQALQAGQMLTDEVFNYQVTDTGGLNDLAELRITIHGRDDNPVATDDTAIAVEAGGVANDTPGTDPIGNVLTNDTDVDDPAASLSVSAIRTGAEPDPGTAGSVGTALAGSFGALVINADGSFTYTVDNNNPTVQALRQAGNTLIDTFTYTVTDAAGATDLAQLTITIQGANDTPVAVNDTAIAIEAGGIANGTPGVNPSGNVITPNDSDVDQFGETLSIAGFTHAAGAGTVGAAFTATYGALLLNADGSYSYTVDNNNAAVQALRLPTDTLTEVFTYTLQDALGATTTATLTVTIHGRDDNPVATDDTAIAVEAGGVANDTPGTDPIGNVLTNDTDVDDPAASLSVSAIRTGAEPDPGTAGAVGTALAGSFGALVINADGSFTYTVDNNNPTVQALRQAGNTLIDTFTYTVTDAAGATDLAQLTITIQGANDTPVAVNDTATAIEAGGIANGTPGVNPSGNVITPNDSDVDQFGETLSIAGFTHAAGAGTVGAPFTATYGALLLNADGSYSYTVDNNNAAVQALRLPTDTLTEVFTYTLQDALGATTTATLTVTIHGRDDNPVATDDTAIAVEAGGVANDTPGTDPIGNVLTNDTDVDDPAASLSVSAIRTGAEPDPGTAGAVGTALAGSFGALVINADGSFTYTVDNNNPTVQALRQAGNTLIDTFTYTVTDAAGATDLAQLTITIQGANDTPVAVNDTAIAIEAGGIANGTPGVNPSGNVITPNDSDVDQFGETLSIAGFTHAAGAGTVGAAFTATYGALLLNADGSYSYTVDNNNAAVQALRLPTDTLTEVFTYTLQDALGATTTATLTVTIHGRDDNPVATDDTAIAVEAGGVANDTPGTDPIGNVLTNDTDVDDPAASLSVSAIRTGAEPDPGTAGSVGTALAGSFGALVINADGSFTYTVDNNNPTVQALRQAGNTLIDTFTYTVTDAAGATDLAQLTITIQGANDTPVAVNDTAIAIEAGGIANGTPGVNPSGNVITPNDSDVDQFGETLSIAGFTHAAGAGTVGAAFTATYGALLLNADGSYSYTVDNNNAAVQALRLPTDTLTEVFTYTLQDALGATTTATLTVTIHGRNDTPAAIDDVVAAQEAGGTFNATPGIDPTGNLLTNDTDVDGTDPRSIDGIRAGAEADGGTFTTVTDSQTIAGLYGTLTVAADGSFSYVVDNTLEVVQRMRGTGDSLVEVFTYRTVDLNGAPDAAQVTINIAGAWDAPIANNNFDLAVPRLVASPGRDAVGNVLVNDTDVDRDDVNSGTGVRVGNETLPADTPFLAIPPGTTRGSGAVIVGQYGEMVIGANGEYIYRVDPLNLTVLGLGPGEVVLEQFSYRVTDEGSLNDIAVLTIVVRGLNNIPFGVNDDGTALEAGGLNNAIAGENPSGNVLDNDIDVDAEEVITVTAYRTGAVDGTGTEGTLGGVLQGTYGTLSMNGEGAWSYTLDNTLPAVQALRISGQVLREVFTYTVTDLVGASDTVELHITIDGRNDTPIAANDTIDAIEAGGVANTTPGLDPTGNVLDNDDDVDSVANGETEQVVDFNNSAGTLAAAGQALQGLYGTLTLNADGSYNYVVDNNNPTVQVLRTRDEILVDSFSYLMRDTEGVTSTANLVIIVRGADDNPVALDDSNVANDQIVAPHATGNVLPNDSDVDGGDAIQVNAIRPGAEAGSGAQGSLGQPLAGRYGTLVINADGSYTYTIDLSNPEVLAAAGFGQILQDVFTYAIVDIAGAIDQAQLVIHLDISAPRVTQGPGPHGLRPGDDANRTFDLGFEPGIFVRPVVRESAITQAVERVSADGSQVGLVLDRSLLGLPPSLAEGLGRVEGQFIGDSVRESALAAQLDLARFLGRHGRVSLTADGLLSDPSVFALTDGALTVGAAQGLEPGEDATTNPTAEGEEADARTAAAFSEQLRRAAARLAPFVQ